MSFVFFLSVCGWLLDYRDKGEREEITTGRVKNIAHIKIKKRW
jgi:hypothetical protein